MKNALKSGSRRRPARFRRAFCAVLSALLLCMLFAASFPVQAATYAFFQPTIQVLKPVNFLNGSFENESNPIPRGNYTYYQQNNVVGWRTVPINPSYNGWSYSDYIQIGQPSTSGDWPVAVPDGSKYTELSCEYPSRLYQNIATVPGTRIYWEFSHTRLMYERNWVYYYNPLLFPPTTGDILQFTLRPAGNPQATPTGAQIISTSLAPRTQSDTWYVRKGYYDVPAGQTNTEFGFAGIQSVISQLNAGNFLDNVKFQTGASLIAEKAIYNSSGSRIDGGYGEYSDIVTIVIKVTNWGETDAAPCVLTDTLWDGLQFVNGSVGGDSGVAGSVSCDAGGNVTAYLGEGAGSAAGGTLKGSKAMNTSATTGKGEQAIVTIRAKITGAPGSVVKDQASVAYNDKGFEAYNPSGKTSYSLIDYGIPDANNLNVAGQNGSFAMNILNADGTVARTYRNVNPGNPETYVNQFTIVDRQTNGTLWYDSNGNGDIDAGESRLSGVNLKMQKLDSGTWTDAQDWSQTPLTAQSGADGSYTFRGILSGQYRVLAELPEASRVVGFKSSAPPAETTAAVGTQGSCDNDADAGTVTDGGTTWAVVQTLDKTGQAFTPAASIYYTHNADFGFVPTIRAEKSAKVVRTQDVSPGTAAAPTGVLYGDTIEYTLKVANNSGAAGISAATVTFEDTLPDGLKYVSASDGSSALSPTVAGQTLTFGNLPAIGANGTYSVVITARVVKPNADLVNAARALEPDGTATQTNATYHHSTGLTLTITKTVKGDLADPLKSFPFYVNLGYAANPSFASLGYSSTVSPYTIYDTLNSDAVVSTGTSAAFGSNTLVNLRHGQKIVFRDLPVNIRYIILEAGNAGYACTASITNETSNAGTANAGAYSADYFRVGGTMYFNSATVAYTNTRWSTTPTGIFLEFWPYILAALLAVGVAVTLIVRGAREKKAPGKHLRKKPDDYEGL